MAKVSKGLIMHIAVVGEEDEIERLVDYAVRAGKQAHKYVREGGIGVLVYSLENMEYRGGDDHVDGVTKAEIKDALEDLFEGEIVEVEERSDTPIAGTG